MSDVVAVCRDKLTLRSAFREQDRALIARLEEAYRRLHAAGVPVRAIPRRVKERLVAEGLSEEQIRGLGVSYSAAKKAVEWRP